jgi:hypothetical protein
MPEFQVFNGNLQIRGTYIHPDLVAAVAMWIDPRFHLRVAQLLRSLHDIKLSIMVQQFEQEKQDLVEMDAAKHQAFPISCFLLYKKNCAFDPYPYKLIKCDKSQRITCVSRLLKEFPKATLVLDTVFAADGKELQQRLKTVLKDKLVFKHNNIKLLCDENDAVRAITVLINQ